MRILLTRPESEIARFATQLEAQGVEPIAAPLLRIEPVVTLPPVPEHVQALLFTSANGVRAYADLAAARDLPVFAVGDATAEAARGVPSVVTRTLAAETVALSREEVRERMSGNLCRCGAHNGIVDAIADVFAGGSR